MRRRILSENVSDEKIFLFFSLLGKSIPHLVLLSGQWDTARVNLENGQATIPVGTLDHHAAVEATWAQERLIQPIGPVGGSDDDHSLARIKAIHLNEQLVQSLLTLVVAVDAGPTLATDGIDFINKDDARGRFLGLIEQVTHATGTDPDQHFDELRTTYCEEWHARLACNGTCQERLAGSRRAHQQHSTRNLATQALELLRRLEKFNHLDKIIFRLIDACHIGECRARPISRHYLCAGLPEAENVLLALCCPATNKEDGAKHDNQGEEAEYNVQQAIITGYGLRLELHAMRVQQRDQVRIAVG